MFTKGQAEDEDETRKAFNNARSVRKFGGQVLERADTHFFETLVRIHRAGDRVPLDGLRPRLLVTVGAGNRLEIAPQTFS